MGDSIPASSAQWIWISGEAQPNTWLRCRRTFRINDVPPKAVVRIAVDSKYWLWVNGNLVIREGGLKRGPTPRDTYVDVVDLASHLRVGENTIAVLVWYWGVDGSSHLSSGQGGLLFDCGELMSDANWRVSRHPAFLPSKIKPYNGKVILSEWDVHFDARLDEAEWMSLGFDDQAWSVPITLGQPPREPWGELVPRPIPFWRDSELLAYDSVESTPSADGGQVVRCKLPANLQVYPYFRIAALEGLKVTVQIERDWKTTEYTTREGEQSFEVPAWGNGHDVTYTFPPGVDVLELRYRETGYDTDFAGSFECDDEVLNLLWKKSVRSTYVNMRDSYMDCPDRERSQWPNDAVPMMEQTFYAFDVRSHALSRKFIREFIDWRTPDGILWGAVPTGRWRGTYREHAAITLATICGIWTYYEYTGDKATLLHAYPHVRDYLLQHWHVDEKELVQHRGPDKVEWGSGTQNWYDWGDHQDWRLMDNTWYAMALTSARNMAVEMKDETIVSLNERYMAIREKFHSLFWQGEFYASPGYAGEPDVRGNAMVHHAQLIPNRLLPSHVNLLVRGKNASIYMEKFVTGALFEFDRTDEAISKIKSRYAAEIASDYSTLPENFGERSNHGWGGWPMTMLSRHVAGIYPNFPWSEGFTIRPRLGPLTHVRAVVPTPAGAIKVEVQRNERFILDVETPVSATIILPPDYWDTNDQTDVPAGKWRVIGTRSSG